MADYLKVFVQEALEERVREDYPHIQKPGLVLGRVENIQDKETYQILTLSILDKDRNADPEYPHIPYVSTTVNVKAGDILVVGMLYGNCVPYVLGRYPDETD